MFVSLDLETTGFDSTKDKIIEFGAVKFDLNGHRETLKFFANPGITLPKIITHITNISNDDLKEAPPFSTNIETVKNFIGNLPIIGHNIQFDIGFLQKNGVEALNPTYDTQELSSILLPNMPSYSLEILSKKLNLVHEEKHRALDDSIAAMELFLKLITEFENLDPELLEKMKNLSQKSNWPLKDLLATIKSSVKKEKKEAKVETKIATTEITVNPTALSNYAKIIGSETSGLFELSPPYDSLVEYLAKTASPETCISIPYHLFRRINKSIPDSITKIDSAKNFLSLARLKEFENKEFFQNFELTALFKYLVWSRQTKTGLLSEVALFHEERNTISKINIDENIANPQAEFFFKKALEKESNSPTICTHQYLIENPQENKKLIIIDFDNLLDSLNYNIAVFLKAEPILSLLKSLEELVPGNATIDTLINKTTILFGLFGIIFEKNNDRNLFTARSTVNNTIIGSKEWTDAQKSLSNIIEISQELGKIKDDKTSGYLNQWKNTLKKLYEILSNPEIDKNLVCLEKDPQAQIVLRKIPYSYKSHLELILKASKNYQIVDECLNLNDEGKFIKNMAGLSAELPTISLDEKNENLQIFVTKDTDGSDPNKIPNFIVEYSETKSNKIAIIFSAKKDLELMTFKLDERNLPIIAQLAGSLGKIQERFMNEKKALLSPVLMVTPYIWKNFEYQENIDTLLIYKIPFDPPSDPELIALSNNYGNPFMELQVPLAIIETKKIINRLKSSSPSLKRIIILDPRLCVKNYGENFINNLNSLAPVTITKLNNLLKV